MCCRVIPRNLRNACSTTTNRLSGDKLRSALKDEVFNNEKSKEKETHRKKSPFLFYGLHLRVERNTEKSKSNTYKNRETNKQYSIDMTWEDQHTGLVSSAGSESDPIPRLSRQAVCSCLVMEVMIRLRRREPRKSKNTNDKSSFGNHKSSKSRRVYLLHFFRSFHGLQYYLSPIKICMFMFFCMVTALVAM
jgi:hypothetical protein